MEIIDRIRKVLRRASGTVRVPSLRRDHFWTEFGVVKGLGAHDCRHDTNRVKKIVWGGQGVEIETRPFLDGLRSCGGFRGVPVIVSIRIVFRRADGTVRTSMLRRFHLWAEF